MKTKKLFLCAVMVVLALTLFEYANAELEFRSNSKVSLPDPTPDEVNTKTLISINQSAKKNSINSTPKGIQLHFRDYPLGEILKSIHDETGIRFNLSSRMAKKIISVDIKAKYWKSSVRKLIEDYSRVEVWTNQPNTSQIWIVESNPL